MLFWLAKVDWNMCYALNYGLVIYSENFTHLIFPCAAVEKYIIKIPPAPIEILLALHGIVIINDTYQITHFATTWLFSPIFQHVKLSMIKSRACWEASINQGYQLIRAKCMSINPKQISTAHSSQIQLKAFSPDEILGPRHSIIYVLNADKVPF